MGIETATPSVFLRVSAALVIATAARTAAADNGDALPPTAAAQEATGTDVVRRKDGGLLRGTIVETTAGVQVRIQLSTGEVATIPWSEVERIDSVAVNSERPSQQVFVHMDAPPEARIQQDKTGDDDWATVCQTPCDKQLPMEFWYRVVGEGIRPSGEFALRGTPGGRETVRVDPASKAAFTVGVIFLPIGLTAAYFSLAAFELAGLQAGFSGDGSNAVTVAWLLLGGGALVATIGLVMVRSNSKSGVTQWGLVPRTASASPPLWARAPSWKEASPESKSLPAAFGVPILRGSF
ncbi:MAG TPA: hypothetical protein VKU41_32350 [Polyangiaceae bacterium]|nr:hypothetical protein [Polyangiaceae bacterium]